ncbi:thioesterase domain-containing protein [Paenibacillus hexagrammi]|uniref:Thioesterase domain-containing protein n=1 Tax=Paenibacillus hexagrammi TaxID=2908839 RepID=A0ABY3SS88_9BACL|nr:thioesterase domain-containing protein [Paenibacillus sp. YPD9-1]UJF35847.1 hypothetical protein L0M14_12650 [Paenibacillus sp. YPD9-1]
MALQKEARSISVYVSAGFATAPDFLDEFAWQVEQGLKASGWLAKVRIYFPYGDWRRKGGFQLREIASDMWRGAFKRRAAYGGKHLAAYVQRHAPAHEPLLLIGHSGGGVAAVHAANQLEQAGWPILGVVQIGSPKCAVAPPLRERTLYVFTTAESGRKLTAIDPVTRLGTWGGWTSSYYTGIWWDPLKYAPLTRTKLSLIGGHPDYFRNHAPYIQQGQTNLQLTMSSIWTWLQRLYPNQF